MNKYRVEFKIKGFSQKFEYYIAASDETNAKRWFLLKALQEMKREGWEYDKVSISYDKMSIIAFFKNEKYFKATLHHLPDKYMKIREERLKNFEIEDLIDKIKKIYKYSRSFPKEELWES